jgi:ketosteroid isomerase-like protein
MSQQNVEAVYQALTAMRDFDYRQAAIVFSPDAEWHNTSVFPGPTVRVGPDAILRFWGTLAEEFDEEHSEIEQMSEVGDHVVVGFRWRGSGRQSGTPIDVRWGADFELVDRRIVRVDIYGDYAIALEAVGLRESPG